MKNEKPDPIVKKYDYRFLRWALQLEFYYLKYYTELDPYRIGPDCSKDIIKQAAKYVKPMFDFMSEVLDSTTVSYIDFIVHYIGLSEEQLSRKGGTFVKNYSDVLAIVKNQPTHIHNMIDFFRRKKIFNKIFGRIYRYGKGFDKGFLCRPYPYLEWLRDLRFNDMYFNYLLNHREKIDIHFPDPDEWAWFADIEQKYARYKHYLECFLNACTRLGYENNMIEMLPKYVAPIMKFKEYYWRGEKLDVNGRAILENLREEGRLRDFHFLFREFHSSSRAPFASNTYKSGYYPFVWIRDI